MSSEKEIEQINSSLQIVAIKNEITKAKIKNIAENKLIEVEEGVDDPISVLTKIDNGTIKTPSETLTITEDGTYDVTNYASVVINVQAGGGTQV